MTALIALKMNILAVVNLNCKVFGKSVNNRRTNTVQTAGHLVSAAAGMLACKYNFNRRDTHFGCMPVGSSSLSTTVMLLSPFIET